MNNVNTSVLVIDDEEMVRDNIEDILMPRKSLVDDSDIKDAASILFDKQPDIIEPKNSNIPVFYVDKASNGMEGVELVKKAVAEGKPYAVIFLDIRMPGWDGLETAMEIRKHDNKAEIIFITAYSDRSIDDIVSQAGQNVGYHCKPYASEEIILLATKAVTDYDRLRNLEKLIESISSIGLSKNQLNSLLKNILEQLALSVGTDMALLGKLHNDYTYEKILSIGAMEVRVNIDELIARVKNTHIIPDEVLQIEDLILARMDSYSVFAVLKKQEMLKTEKMYLLKLFVQNAAQAIRNAELSEKLIQKEKLSAVGKAIGMVMHDLRSPIKNLKVVTDMIKEQGNLGEDNELLDILDMCAVQASEIFDDFLDYIKESPIKKEPVNIAQVIEASIKLINASNEKRLVNIQKSIPDNLIIQGDERKLKRVVMNLINNGIEALEHKKIEGATIQITAKADTTKTIAIEIKDNGTGIPEDIIRTLFEPFITKDKHNGTGLGLAIVKQFVTDHGGTIGVTNDSGAVFTILLPIN